jgi:hypothetical protein
MRTERERNPEKPTSTQHNRYVFGILACIASVAAPARPALAFKSRMTADPPPPSFFRLRRPPSSNYRRCIKLPAALRNEQ